MDQGNRIISEAEAVPVQDMVRGAVVSSNSGRNKPSIWSRIFGSNTSSTNSSVAQPVSSTALRDLPDQYQDCRSYDEKVAWIHSPRGQSILAQRPVLKEYQASGRLLRIMQNKHWDMRLNEWLFISSTPQAVPLGVGIDMPEELKPNARQELGIYRDNPPIQEMFRTHPAFLTRMPFPTSAKYNILTDGFTTFSQIIPPDVVDSANAAISRMVVESEEFNITQAERIKNPKRGLDPFFTSGGTNDRDVLALYYCSPIASLVESLLHNELLGPESVSKGTFRPRAGGAQVAFRFSQARPGGWWASDGDRKIGGRSWHLDGMDKGQYGPFSLLIGVALSDQLVDNCGNLGVHAGSHHTLKPFLKKYSAACDHSGLDKNNAQAIQERRMYAVSLVHNKPLLDEPVQVKLAKGDVVFALHKLAHLGTPNYSDNIRKMVYFRVSHRELEKLRIPALEDLWIEYEGMSEFIYSEFPFSETKSASKSTGKTFFSSRYRMLATTRNPSAGTGRRVGGWENYFGMKRSGPRGAEDVAIHPVAQEAIPAQYRDCKTYSEKVAWINCPRGQYILSERPELKEYHANKRLFMMMKNDMWDERLNKWLFISEIPTPVPDGMAIATEEPIKRKGPAYLQMFEGHSHFLSPMALPTAAKADLRKDGYTVLNGIIPPDIIDNALSAIDKMFAATSDVNIFEAEKRKFPMRTMADPYFEHGLTHDKDVMALFYCSPVYCLVESLLHNEVTGPEYIAEGRFQPRALGAKVAYRVPEPMPVSDGCCVPSSATSSRPLGGAAWHIDAMDIGQLCPFSVLIGVALSDQLQDACGNLAVHPGSHVSLMPFMKKFAETRGLDIADLQVAQARRQRAIALLQNKPVLDEPVQVKLAKGDVVIALFKLAHLGTPNYSENTRKMVYFRVSHRELEKLRIPALDDMWIEYEGMSDVVK